MAEEPVIKESAVLRMLQEIHARIDGIVERVTRSGDVADEILASVQEIEDALTEFPEGEEGES